MHSIIDALIMGSVYSLAVIGSFRNVPLHQEQVINLIIFGLIAIAVVEIVFWIFKIYFILTGNLRKKDTIV